MEYGYSEFCRYFAALHAVPAESPRPGRSRARSRHTDSAPRRGAAVSAADELHRENEALRARIAALSAASLRISASLDLETVLNEVAESARSLTGARYAAIATIDEAGAPQDFVTSGFTAEEHRAHGGMVRGPAPLRALPRPRRAAADRRRSRPCPRTRLLPGPAAMGNLPGHADAPSRRPCRKLLPGREGGRERVHRRGRGDPGAVRLPGGDRDRQRADLPRRAADPRGPRGADRDLAGGRRGVRRAYRPPGLAQPRGEADRGGPAHGGPPRRGAARDPHLPLRRRAARSLSASSRSRAC